jgi:hypothetical protein
MFTVQINTDNTAFDEDTCRVELARILRLLANKVAVQPPPEDEEAFIGGTLHDMNGNTVGSWGWELP